MKMSKQKVLIYLLGNSRQKLLVFIHFVSGTKLLHTQCTQNEGIFYKILLDKNINAIT